jgi:hypothetical protein
MLLHVIEAPRPIDFPNDPRLEEWCCKEMGHPVSIIHYLEYLDPAQESGVACLAPRSRVEGRLVEIDPRAAIPVFDDRGFEIRKI